MDGADSVRSVEDLDSEVVLSYAEFKAVATGNPLIRDHAEVAAEVARLSRLATNHARAQRALPTRLLGLEERIDRLTAAAERLTELDHTRVDTRGERFGYDTPDGVRFAERSDTGRWLSETLGRIRTTGVWEPVGTLGGAGWEAQRWRDPYGHSGFELRIAGDHDAVAWTTGDLYQSAPHTVVTRLERHLDKIPDRLAAARRDLSSSVDQLTRGRQTVGMPFPHRDRLTELTARLAELETALATVDNSPTPPAPHEVDAADTFRQSKNSSADVATPAVSPAAQAVAQWGQTTGAAAGPDPDAGLGGIG